MAPAHYIAPWVAPTWDDVVAIFKKALAESPADASLAFFGFDKLLHGVDAPTAATLIRSSGIGSPVIDNSGHAAYVTSAVVKALGWDENPRRTRLVDRMAAMPMAVSMERPKRSAPSWPSRRQCSPRWVDRHCIKRRSSSR